MRLIGQDVLTRAIRKHPVIRGWIQAWVINVESAHWESLTDVRHTYPSADGVKLRSRLVVTVFNVNGNKYRLLASIRFDAQFVQVLELLTHAEYDKSAWKGKY